MFELLHGDAHDNQLNVTVTEMQAYGMSGNDTITSENFSDVLLVGGDGNDSVYGFNETSTLKISGEEYMPVTVGNDVVVNGRGAINVVTINSTENLSAAVTLADGSAYRFNHTTKSWQSA